MKILIVHQYFKTPEEGSGIRSWYLAQAFAHAGYHVEVISGHDQLNSSKEYDGFRVRYFKIPYSNHFGFVRRTWAFIRFVSASRKHLHEYYNYDLLYVISTPLTTGLIGRYAKREFGIPYIFEVGDLWPIAPIQMGVIKHEFVKNKLFRLEERIYHEAIGLVGLSAEIKKAMSYVVDYKKEVAVITNMSDCTFFKPFFGLPDEFSVENPLIIGYQGAIGKANHLEFLIHLASEFQETEHPVKFRIMGDGSEKNRLIESSKNLANVEWVKPGGKSEVKVELEKCHVTYISYAPYQVLETGCPNKLFDGLAAGKLILINFDGWIKELISEHECGFSYDPSKPKQAIELLFPFISSPSLLLAYQANSRDLAEKEFDVPVITSKAVNLVKAYR
jgi:glycosyltransferase involved in cell wall biosynthesis